MMIVLTAGETHTEAAMALTSLQANQPPSGEHPSVTTTSTSKQQQQQQQQQQPAPANNNNNNNNNNQHQQTTTRGKTKNAY